MSATTIGRPVSAHLEAELRSNVRKNGIVVWLDQRAQFNSFVDQLVSLRAEGSIPYEVHAFRGSYLRLMMALDGLASGTEKVPLLIHLPGFTEESVRDTPMLELYEAGVRYRKALETLVSEAAAGKVATEEIAAFRTSADLSVEGADAWLSERLDDVVGGLGAQLRVMPPSAVLDDLLSSGPVAIRIAQPADENVLWQRLGVWTGLPLAWREATSAATRQRAEDVAFAAASWALCVEYVDDLKRAPVSPHLTAATTLPRSVIDTCRALATHLRQRHAAFYKRTADETEALLFDEVEAARAEDLGKIDTFRFEEDKVLKAAVDALDSAQYTPAAEWAARRVGEHTSGASFWLGQEPARQAAWQLVAAAARLGIAISRAGGRIVAGPAADATLDAAVAGYVERGAEVDQAHRQLEQRRTALLFPQLPEFEALRARLDQLRRLWRRWADTWALEFNAICRAHGFVPGTSLQQRTLFDEVVKTQTQEPGTTAYFVVDALRYEMAVELSGLLDGMPATTLQLRARLAELPTVTDIGMNVLAPVARNGRLSLALNEATGALQGFRTGEFRVLDPESRKRAMHERVGGATCPWLSLEEVVSRDAATLKRTVSHARLVVVHSQEIDNAGEKGVGPAVFDVVMQRLRAALRLLRDAGVRRFVVTSDHGFLLLDDATGSAQSHGRRVDPKRRYVFSPVAADHTGEARVALSELGYDGLNGYVMFPETTAVFDTGRRPMSFVHGGNSLQERVIPVLTLVHRAPAGASTAKYGIVASAAEPIAGMHCVEGRVEVVEQHALDFGGPAEVELALRVSDADGVQVELCQARGRARIAGGTIVATVGERFEVFFRLLGEREQRVLVELRHSAAAADVEPFTLDARFSVTASRALSTSAPVQPDAPSGAATSWLDQLGAPGVRHLFEHLAMHGTVTESEATAMLGGPRELRRFALEFDAIARKAPFGVRIEFVAGVKRYVREGSA